MRRRRNNSRAGDASPPAATHTTQHNFQDLAKHYFPQALTAVSTSVRTMQPVAPPSR
jgi:hypothetical protein